MLQLLVTSSAFEANGPIPRKFTCDGKNVSPPLHIENIPASAKCLALIVDDPDAPIGTWVHWLAWNIPTSNELAEGQPLGIEGLNDFRQHHYGGPCPPSGTHRYFFKVYALDAWLDLPANTRKPELERAIAEHLIGSGVLIGSYSRA